MFETYPEFLTYVVLIVGCGLALTHPRSAFLFCCFGVSALNLGAAFFTRTFLGPYFNLVDAFIVVLAMALIMGILSRQVIKLSVPTPVLWLFITWAIGTFTGLAKSGLSYEVLREARWALNFPISMLVAANFVTDERRSREFVISLFWGAIIAALQHIWMVRSSDWRLLDDYSLSVTLSIIRNIGFVYSPITYFFIAGMAKALFPTQKRSMKLIWNAGMLLFLASIILNQTRSVWISTLASVFIVTYIVTGFDGLFKALRISVVLAAGITLIFWLFLPTLNPLDVILARTDTLTDEILRNQTTLTRINAIRIETQAWWNGNYLGWLFGRGLAYRWADEWRLVYGAASGEGQRVAWGHIGYVSYLANLGLLGLGVYGVYVPLTTLKRGRRLISSAFHQAAHHSLAVLGIACVFSTTLTSTMSSSFLQPEMVVPGLLFGAVLGISYKANLRREDVISGSNHGTVSENHHRYALIQSGNLYQRDHRISAQPGLPRTRVFHTRRREH